MIDLQHQLFSVTQQKPKQSNTQKIRKTVTQRRKKKEKRKANVNRKIEKETRRKRVYAKGKSNVEDES